MKKQGLLMINSPGLTGDLDKTVKMVLKAVKDGELTGEVKFDVPSIPQAEPVLAKARVAAERFAYVRKELQGSGLKVGITVQFIIHGDRGCTVSDPEKFPRCVDMEGKPTRRICPLGKNIQQYAYDVFRIFAQAKPDMLDMDEDIRLTPFQECFCPAHIRLFNELKGGTPLSREELVPLLTSPVRENQQIKDCWHRAIIVSLEELARAARRGIDSVAPAIPCFNKIIRSELSIGIPVCKVLAGTHPMVVRVSNSFYGPWRPQDFPELMFDTAYQAHYLRQAGVQRLRSESDACPETRLATSARQLHAEMTGSILHGIDDLEMRDMNPPADREPYRRSHIRHAGFYRTLADWCKDAAWQGFSIPFPAELRSCWDHDGCEARQNTFFGGEFCGRMGFPVRFGAQDGVMLLSDQVVDSFSDDEVRGMLGKSVIMTGVAAKRLQDRGFGAELGITIREEPFRIDGMMFADDPEWNGRVAGRNGSANNVRMNLKTLVPLPGTEALGHLYTVPHRFSQEYKNAAPSETVCHNRLGGTVIVMADSYFGNDFFHKCVLINLNRKAQFAHWYARLAEQKLLYAEGNYECALRHGKLSDGRELVAALNLSLDPMPALVLANAGKAAKVEKLMPDGSVKPVPFRNLPDGNLRIAGKLETMVPAVYLLTYSAVGLA